MPDVEHWTTWSVRSSFIDQLNHCLIMRQVPLLRGWRTLSTAERPESGGRVVLKRLALANPMAVFSLTTPLSLGTLTLFQSAMTFCTWCRQRLMQFWRAVRSRLLTSRLVVSFEPRGGCRSTGSRRVSSFRTPHDGRVCGSDRLGRRF